MRNLTVAFLTVAATLTAATGAIAGETSTFNRYSTTHQYNGHSVTNVDATVNTESLTKTISNSTKVEAVADKGDINRASVTFKGGEFSASATSSNGRPVDPVAAIYTTDVTQVEISKTSETADITTKSSYDFSGTTFEHEVGSRF